MPSNPLPRDSRGPWQPTRRACAADARPGTRAMSSRLRFPTSSLALWLPATTHSTTTREAPALCTPPPTQHPERASTAHLPFVYAIRPCCGAQSLAAAHWTEIWCKSSCKRFDRLPLSHAFSLDTPPTPRVPCQTRPESLTRCTRAKPQCKLPDSPPARPPLASPEHHLGRYCCPPHLQLHQLSQLLLYCACSSQGPPAHSHHCQTPQQSLSHTATCTATSTTRIPLPTSAHPHPSHRAHRRLPSLEQHPHRK